MPDPAASTETILAIAGLRCGYGRTEVIHGLDLDVRRGEIVCLIGANGAGKSTVINAVVGVIPVSSRLDQPLRPRRHHHAHRDARRARPRDRSGRPRRAAPAHRRRKPSARRLCAPVRSRGSPTSWTRVYALFPILAERRDQLAGTLSGGEQQMLVIGRALMSRPRLLVLDEPSFGLAPKIIDRIFEVVTALRADGLTILLVEQNANVALEVSQRGYVLESGTCILSDAAARLREDTLVRDIYFGSG